MGTFARLSAHSKADHRLNGLCIAFAISFATRSRADGSYISAGEVRRSNSRRRSASSLVILLTDLARSGLSLRSGIEAGPLAPLASINFPRVMFLA
jgi:hypothetical protein